MMKNKITVQTTGKTIRFYLHTAGKRFYLCSQKFTREVYEFFRQGRSENEVRSFHMWNRDLRLDKTITKLPMYIHYVLKYVA